MRIVVAMVLIVLTAQSALARGGHHHHGAEAGDSGDRRAHSAYGKAKVEERDKLIDKLKNMKICRGC